MQMQCRYADGIGDKKLGSNRILVKRCSEQAHGCA